MTTHTTRSHSFTTARGNEAVVFNTKRVGTNTTGFRGFGETVRTFAVVCGTEVEVETGCAFRAVSAVAAKGF